MIPPFIQYAPVAQLDRVLPSEGKGRAFESRRVRHLLVSFNLSYAFYIYWVSPRKGL